MKIAICFLSTIKNHFNFINLKKQASESKKHQINIYEYIDNKKDYKIKNGYVIFNYDYLKNKFNYHYTYSNLYSSVSSNAGIQFLPLLDMYINHKEEYDIYMFYEDDLSYFGKENLFDKIDFDCDVLFQNKRNIINKNEKTVYQRRNRYFYENKNLILYQELLNIYAVNKKFLNDFIEFIKNNYDHHETLISTFALNNNYKVNYINDYFSVYTTWLNIINKKIKKYDLIHPIKTLEKYQAIYNNYVKQ